MLRQALDLIAPGGGGERELEGERLADIGASVRVARSWSVCNRMCAPEYATLGNGATEATNA